MARKFRNSSNSEEFGALALLDFSQFLITKPQRLFSAKSDHSERNEIHFVDGRQHFYITQIFQFSEIYHFAFSPQFFNPSPFRQFLSQTLHLLDSGPSLMCHQGYCFKTCQNFKTCPYRCLKVVGRICPPPQQPGKKNAVANRVNFNKFVTKVFYAALVILNAIIFVFEFFLYEQYVFHLQITL